MPYKFTPEYSILSSIRKELDPVKELASSAEKLAKSSEERSQIAERLANSSESIAKSSQTHAKASETLSSLAIKKLRKPTSKAGSLLLFLFLLLLWKFAIGSAYSKMIPERTNKKFNIANTRATSETVIFDGFFSFLSFFILPLPSHLSGISRFLIL